MAKRKAAKAKAKARKKTTKAPAKRRAAKTVRRKAAPRAKAKKAARAKARPAAKKPAPKKSAAHSEGTWAWADLVTTDVADAKKFYSALFGWKTTDMPMPAGAPGFYTTLELKGGTVGGMSQPTPEQMGGMPPHWNLYVSVDNVDATFAKATANGAKPVMPPFDIPGVGRMAVFQDPTDAFLSIWQKDSPNPGFTVKEGTLGAFCWGELMTHDTARAADFYTKIFPWTKKVGSFGEHDYIEFQKGKDSVAGMMKIGADMGPMPPSWGLYFSVGDTEATVKTAEGLGAKVLVPPMDAEGVGRFAVLQDPQGAIFSVIKFG